MHPASSRIDAIMTTCPVISVFNPTDVADAVDVAKALVRGGSRVIEVTLRNPNALAAMRAIIAEVPDAIVGAGTVLNGTQFDQAVDAGAQFVVSPGLTANLLAAASDIPVPLLPGIASASELMTGIEAGLQRFKFFPATAIGGIRLLQAYGGPFPFVRFCPTGGITPETARDWLSLEQVLCIGGSWLTPADAIAAKDWDRIETLGREAAALA